jgi:Domain of unknown function (DUF4190)/Domain of unknown function (DUF1707)
MRASDDDRWRVQSVLNDAYADGRLSQPEWDERVSQLASAATYSELDRLTSDLLVPYTGPPPPAGPPPTNSLAIAALICGIGQLVAAFPAGIAAIILGHMARRQIRRTGEQGRGLALTGLVLGYVGTIGLLVLVLVLLLLIHEMQLHPVGP